MTATLRLTTGHELTGDTVADVIAAEWGPDAQLRPSRDRNDPRVGQIVEPVDTGGFRVLATVAWIDTDEPEDEPGPDRIDHLTEVRAAARASRQAQQALIARVKAADRAGVPVALIADAAQVTRQTAYRWIRS